MRVYQRRSRLGGDTETAPRSIGADYCEHNPTARQLRRRRAASQRMVPLDCGCPKGPHADPLACLCTFPPLTDHQLDGWVATAQHVLAAGQMPLVPIEVRRALWRRPADRELAELLHDACAGVAS